MQLSASPSLKNLKKGVQSGPTLKHGSSTQQGHSALLEHWHKLLAWPKGSWIEINLTFFLFFRDKDASQFIFDHLASFLKHLNLYK